MEVRSTELLTPTVFILFLAILPGFLSVTVWARSKTWAGHPSDLRIVLQALVLSLAIQILASPLTLLSLYPVRTELDLHPVRVVIWLGFTVLVFPIVGGVLAGKLTDHLWQTHVTGETSRLSRFLRPILKYPIPPTAWDWFWLSEKADGAFVVVEFADGRSIAGTYGIGSYALTSPDRHGAFLTDQWELDSDGNITRRSPYSDGIMILDTESIRSIRVIREE